MSLISVANQLREAVEHGHLGGELLHALAAVERRSPGLLEKAALWLWNHPDKPLKPVSESTQSERVRETAADRWDVTDAQISEPESLGDLVRLLEHARDQGLRLRMAGSARSLSVVSQPPAGGTLVATSRYGQRLALPTFTLREGVEATALYRAEAGRVLADVLIDLSSEGRSLSDMGSGDFQALAGALSTATHGSGAQRSAFPAMVRSMDVVTYGPGGSVIIQRVEPTAGITDRARFEAWEARQPLRVELVQDDAIFNAWIVSIGCLGAIYSVTLESVPAYWLRETRTIEWWSDVQASMADDLAAIPYYELLLSTWSEEHNGAPDYRCLVTRRRLVTDPAEQHVTNGRPETAALAQTRLGHWITEITAVAAMTDPVLIVPYEQKTALHGTEVKVDAPYTDKSYEVLLLRLDINANSSELAVPLGSLPDGRVDPAAAIEAANVILAMDAENQAAMKERVGDGNPFDEHFDALCETWREHPLHMSPIALRFVAPDPGHLSMWNGGHRCAIEMPMPGADALDRMLVDPPEDPGPLDRLYMAYNEGRQALFRKVEDRLVAWNGTRPHWGQVNFLDWERVAALYPEASAWKAVYDTNNQGGVFDGPITEQLGISVGGE